MKLLRNLAYATVLLVICVQPGADKQRPGWRARSPTTAAPRFPALPLRLRTPKPVSNVRLSAMNRGSINFSFSNPEPTP